MHLAQTQPCEICGGMNWKIVVHNEKESVCSGRELVRNDQPLIKGMCENCGMVYTLRSPLDQDLDKYYTQVYSSKLKTDNYDYVNFAKGKRFGQAVNDFVLGHEFPRQGRLLDIGCGKGFFEQAFIEKYPDWNVEGVDPSERSIEIGRQLAPQANFHCQNFRGEDFPDNQYDLVAMHTVLNRVPPRTFIGAGADLLKRDGVMSIAIAMLPEAPFELYFADHHYMYHSQHLRALAEEFGLELVVSDEVGSIWRYLFRKSGKSTVQREALRRESERIKHDVLNYALEWRRLFERVTRLKDAGKRVAFYGAGTTMMITLAQTEFPRELVFGVYDDNTHKHGEEWWGTHVQPRSEEISRADAVVLCAGPSGVDVMKCDLMMPEEKLLYFGMPEIAALNA